MDILQVNHEKQKLERLIKKTSEYIETNKTLLKTLDTIQTDRAFDEDIEIPRLSYQSSATCRKEIAKEMQELREYNRRYADIITEWKKFSPEERGRIDNLLYNKEELARQRYGGETNETKPK